MTLEAVSTAQNHSVREMDKVLFVAVVFLSLFGIVMIYSASGVSSAVKILADRDHPEQLGSDSFFLIRQMVYCAMGIVGMLLVSRIDYRLFQKSWVVWSMLLLAFAGVLATRLFGRPINGAYRWLSVGPISVQPAEALKVALVIWLAYSLNKKQLKIKSFSIGFLPHLIVPTILMIACLMQPDLGTTVVMGLLVFSLLFVSGARLGYILLAILAAAPVLYLLITGREYRLRRIMAFLDPLADRLGDGYQLSQSLFGYAAGGVTGRGLGDGLQKLLYLPEAHNDFIGAIIGEELGMVGIWVLLMVYIIIVGRGIVIGVRSKDLFGLLVAVGISVLFALQALLNLAVSMGLLPTKGLTLPFVSYGGSALLISMGAAGVLLSISRGSTREIVVPEEGDAPEEKNARHWKSKGNTRVSRPFEKGV